MNPHEPFPLGCLPQRVRETVLAEFKGRHPSRLEVARVPDRHWLASPSIGAGMLTRLRSFTRDLKPDTIDWHIGTLTQTQQLARQKFLQDKLKRLQREANVVAAELSALEAAIRPRPRVPAEVQIGELSLGL
jgi:hypothetical protein